jgi:hypothetical protein
VQLGEVRMKKKKTRAEIRADFQEHHKKHPEAWRLFKEFTFKVMRAGLKHYSARAIFHRIRWHTQIEKGEEDKFKINNNYSHYYVELFEEEYPQYVGFFTTKESADDTYS